MMADASTNNGGALATAAGQQTASSVGGGSGGALDPNVIPQWKKELIQRRKNLAKTIGAVATQVHDSASTVAAAISASASSPVQAHPRTPTGGFPVGSPFYAGAGTKDTQSANTSSSPLDGTVPDSETLHPAWQVESEHDKQSTLSHNNDTISPSVNAHQAVSSPTTPTTMTTMTAGSFMGVHFGANEHLALQQSNNNQHYQHQQHQQPHRGGVGGGARATASEAVVVVVQPTASGPSPTSLPTANGAHSHSNAGSEHSGSSAAIANATNRTGSGNSGVIVERESSSTVCNSAVVVSSNSNSNNNNGKSVVSAGVHGQTQQQQQQHQQQPNSRDGVAARKMVAATAAEEIVVVYEKNSVLGGGLDATGGGVVVGGGGIGAIGDAGEELKYGPGIVSRLRCRYLSLALRQSVAKQRPSLNSMRRATSLNNLLDEESEDLSEREQSIGSEGTGGGVGHQQKKYQSQNYQNHHHHHQHHHQQQQQQQPQREHYSNGNGNNHNHNHNHHQQQQQQQLHPTVVLQPPYQKQQHHFAPKQQPWIQQQQHKEDDQQQQGVGGVVKTAPFLRGVQNSYTRASRQVEKKNEYNRYTKHHRGASGADAVLLKRARSVEALVRYDHKAWERDGANPVAPALAPAPAPAALAVSSSAEVGSNVIILDEIAHTTTTTTTTVATTATVVPAGAAEQHGTTNGISSSVSPTAMLMNGMKGGGTGGGAGGASDQLPLLVSDCVTIEEKIINGREKGDPKPKRLTSIIDADERPPPDVVKQTMKIFEANANRRGGRGVTGTANNNGVSEVATKVASYRSIIISGSVTAGATTAAAAVSSAVGPGDKPPITHPKPPLSPKKPNIKPRTASPKHQQQQQQQQHQATAAKPPPTPKSLEAVNNLKNAPGTTVKNNNKPSPMVVGGGGGGSSGTIESTPPSPPARSKHTTTATALNGASVGVVLAKNVQSTGAGAGAEGGGSATGTQSDPTDVKPNALKNGSTVRDHHNYENGTTQTTPSAKTSSSATLPPGSDGCVGHQHKHTANIAQEATAPTAAVVFASSSPSPSGICDSPSIQQLASKLGSLHLATSTPTGAANGTVSSVHDRRNLEYVTSDEEEEEEDDDDDDDVDGKNESGRRNTTSYTVNPESSESEDARDIPGAAGSDNDADDDEAEEEEEEEDIDGEQQRSVRKISRTAMENIARAGTTTQFRFNGAVKSYLPGAGSVAGGGGTSGNGAAPSTKPPAPPIPKSRESLTGKANGASPASVVPIEVNGRLPPEGASVPSANSVNSGGNNSNHNSSAVVGSSAVQIGACATESPVGSSVTSLTRREIEKNQINREKSGEPAGPVSSGTSSINGTGATPANAGPPSTTAGSVVAGGCVLVASANNPNHGGASGMMAKQPTVAHGNSGGPAIDSTTSFVAKWGTGGVGGAGVTVAAAGQSPLAGLVPARKKGKPPPNHQQDGTNTMVFNFSDRKDVPDYIENDGVIIRPRPRELPKPGESGFVVLGDLTLETSTDPDDGLPTGPPSPCNGEFANAYIVINGKSSMRNKTSRSNKFKIQFDDSLTSTYEYPSETSLLDTNGYDDADNSTDTNGGGIVPPAFADNGLLSHTNKLLSSVPLGSAPFASYTPVKAAIDTTFELGVTRTPSPSAASTASSTGSNGSLTSSNNSSSSSSSSNSHQSATAHGNNGEHKQHTLPHTVPNGHHHLHQHHHHHSNHQVDRSNSNNGLHSNGHSTNNGPSDTILNGTGEPLLSGTGEPESIQYLKPASDEQTVNWSQGTRVTDLLF